MTPTILLVTTLLSWQPSDPTSDPFAQDAQYSNTESVESHPIHGPWLRRPPTAPTTTYSYSQAGGGASTHVADQSWLCPCPAPESPITDWDTVYTMYLGLQVEGLGLYEWSDPTLTKEQHVLLHLKSSLQTIRKVWLRDFGLDLKVAHVRFSNNESQPGDTSWASAYEQWDAIEATIPYKMQGVMRLVGSWYGGGTALGTCTAEKMGRIVYPMWDFWHMAPDPFTGEIKYPDRNAELSFLIHELGHLLLGLSHAQCYRLPNGEPIEKCNEGNCWPEATECPTYANQSFMGYCWWCNQNAPLRIGPLHGPLANVARNHIQNLATCKPTHVFPTYTINTSYYTFDFDQDEYPDVVDNCQFIPNNTQEDYDMDGHGDACDGCQVSPNHSLTLLQLLPIFLLLTARKSRKR